MSNKKESMVGSNYNNTVREGYDFNSLFGNIIGNANRIITKPFNPIFDLEAERQREAEQQRQAQIAEQQRQAAAASAAAAAEAKKNTAITDAKTAANAAITAADAAGGVAAGHVDGGDARAIRSSRSSTTCDNRRCTQSGWRESLCRGFL